MAIVRPGGLLGPISGTLGNVTYRAKRASMIAGVRAGPKRKPSAKQLQARQALAAQAKAWGELTNAERLAWNAWADNFDVLGDPRASTAPNGFDRFLAYARLAAAAGLPQLSLPTNSGVGPAEFALLDLFADVEADVLRIKMLEPFLERDASPTRIYTQLGPARQRRRRTDPRAYSTVHSFNPALGQPGVDLPEFVVPLPASAFDRPWYWGSSRTTGGDGNVSLPGVWPLETAGPGEGWVFRMRPIADFIDLNRVERTADDFLVFTGSILGVPFVDPHDLTAAENATIEGLVDTIDTISPWRTTSVNLSRLTVPSVDITLFPQREKTLTSQPTTIVVGV